MQQAGKRRRLTVTKLYSLCCPLRRSDDPVSPVDSVLLELRVAICRAMAHIASMDLFPRFEAKVMTSGRWFVSVITGHGPDSHVGNFATDEDAKNWILTKSKYWPGKPDTPK